MVALGVFIGWVTELTVTLRFWSGTEAHRGHRVREIHHVHRVVFLPYNSNECGVVTSGSTSDDLLWQRKSLVLPRKREAERGV